MFKNDRMMMILTGLVLAIFAGSMVKYGDRIMGLLGGENVIVSQDDSFSVRAGSSQILDVLSNDDVFGPIVVLSRPSCGTVSLTGNNKLAFDSDGDCTGEVEFAYCVESEGNCAPKAVRINVINVSYSEPATRVAQTPAAQPENTSRPEPPPPNAAVADNRNPDAPRAMEPESQAPEIDSFAVEMAPPSLASPSVSELISPDIAVASIRQPSSGLNSAVSIDQNIATQNSAARAQTSGAAPSGFQPLDLGEASNISLGGGERNVASVVAAPTGLQRAPQVGANIVQLERGPEALAMLPQAPTAPPVQDAAPRPSSGELTSFAPVEIASAQAQSPSFENSFSAAPIEGGPIALIALSIGSANDAAGESLNLSLSEPGAQGLASLQVRPSALAPASEGPSAVSILEREPAANVVSPALGLPDYEASAEINIAEMDARNIARSPLPSQNASPPDGAFAASGLGVVASMPVQVSAVEKMLPTDSASDSPANSAVRPATISTMIGPLSRTRALAALSAPAGQVFGRPRVDLSPARQPEILQASLPETLPVSPNVSLPSGQSACNIALSGASRSGANVQLQINAACKPLKMATITHAGIVFSVLTDENGAATVTFPAMEDEARISVEFDDQSSATTTVSVRGMDAVIRAGVSWRGNMNLDLNAIEFGAAVGSEGYITPQSPRDYRSSRIKGGGYLVQLGDPALEGGALSEVYSLPVARNQQRGTVELSILIDDAAQLCGQVVAAQTSRTREGLAAIVRNVRFNVPTCGTVAGQITLPGAIDDIRLARR